MTTSFPSDRGWAGRRHSGQASGLGFDIVHVTPAAPRRIAEACARWGKGAHSAALNFGDCFAYDLAKEHACPLLFVGEGFARTDITRAIRSAS